MKSPQLYQYPIPWIHPMIYFFVPPTLFVLPRPERLGCHFLTEPNRETSKTQVIIGLEVQRGLEKEKHRPKPPILGFHVSFAGYQNNNASNYITNFNLFGFTAPVIGSLNRLWRFIAPAVLTYTVHDRWSTKSNGFTFSKNLLITICFFWWLD